MNRIKNNLSKMRQHISSEEFKQIESIGLLRLIPKLLKVSMYLMCLLMIRWGVLETFDSLLDSAGKVEIVALYMTAEILLTLLHTILILMIFIVIPIRMTQNKNYLLMKDYFYIGMILLVATLPVSINITAQQGDYLGLAILTCLVFYFLMQRVIYLKELQVLIQLGVIDKENSNIKFYRIKEVNYVVNRPEQLTTINQEWLPYVDVEMIETNRTVLNQKWNSNMTSRDFSFVVQSKFSGIMIYHHVAHYFTREEAIMMPKDLNQLNESEEK